MSRYYDATPVIENKYPFCFIIGGRGIGKTYSTLRYIMDVDDKFIYARTTKEEIDISASKDANPFKVLNRDRGRCYEIKPGKIPKVIEGDGENSLKGYCLPISTFGNLRGVDFSDVNLVIWDEFICQGKLEIKDIDTKFFNFYETVNRNRELAGIQALKIIMLSNAVSISNPLLISLDLVDTLEMMLKNKQKKFADPNRGVYIEMPTDVDIIDEKANTALYKLTKGTRFYEHAIDNKFAYDSWYNVTHKHLAEYIPICSLDSIYIYRHKSNGTYYACRSYADCPHYDTKDTFSIFKRNHWIILHEMYISGKLYFSSISVKKTLENYL